MFPLDSVTIHHFLLAHGHFVESAALVESLQKLFASTVACVKPPSPTPLITADPSLVATLCGLGISERRGRIIGVYMSSNRRKLTFLCRVATRALVQSNNKIEEAMATLTFSDVRTSFPVAFPSFL